MNTEPDAVSVAHGGPTPGDPGVGTDPLAWFESWLARQPGAVAVESGDGTLTFAELDGVARQVAAELNQLVRPGDVVGVCLDRSALLVAVAVALGRLGAAYLPLGPRPGRERLATVVTTTPVRCLLTGAKLPAPAGWKVRALTGLARMGGPDGPPALCSPPVPSAGGLALGPWPEPPFYVVMTSGSTGIPKAVAVGRSSLANLLRWYCHLCELGPGSRVGLLTGVTFDPHLLDLWSGLGAGATLCVPPEEAPTSPGAVIEWLCASRVTACHLPTPLAEVMFDLPWPPGLPLRHLSVGGDRMRAWPPLVETQVHNLYGPAEATVVTTSHLLSSPDDDRAGLPPIGRPISGVQVIVSGEDGSPVPIGEPGELLVAGSALALGYIDPELTRRRFVTVPGAVGGRAYRTGDRVLMRPDGVIEFLGRLDDQVKVRGVRIELAEVEAALEHSPEVRHAVVVPVASPSGDVRLVAFVRPRQGCSIAPPELLEAARGWLPEQAVPAAVHVVDEFPLAPTGKVDRAALAAAAATPSRETQVAGDTVLDAVLAACRGLLPLEVTPDTNFLDGGGDSIAAARLLVAVEAAWGVRLRAPEVLRQPDLRSLAALIERRRGPHRPESILSESVSP